MRKRIYIQQFALMTLAAVSLGCLPSSANDLDEDTATQQAVNLFKDGKTEQAVDLEEKAVREKPNGWLGHSVLSYFYWQQGNIPDAIIEGQKSIRCAPRNDVALTNLGHIYQQLADYKDAIPIYEQARKAAPENWLPWICLARSYVGNDQAPEGLKVLQEMSSESSDSFAWNYQLGETYLTLEKPDLATTPLTRALDLARTPEQESASAQRLLVSLLCDSQIDRARTLMDRAIYSCNSNDAEAYVRSASALLSDSNPAAGKKLLQAALKNLTRTGDSDGFFRLGKIFEQKANQAHDDSMVSRVWLENAEAALNQAIELNPGMAKNHLALAAILNRNGKPTETAKELEEAANFDRYDPVAPFLGLQFGETSKPLDSQTAPDTAAKKSSNTHPIAVNFEVSGLTCGCQATKIDEALLNMKGIALASFIRRTPYTGTLFVDPSVTTISETIAQCTETVFGSAKEGKTPPPKFVFAVKSQQPVGSLDEAVAIAQTAQYGDLLEFHRQFAMIKPVMPTSLLAEHPGSTI